jgi:hypothetical protein
MRGRVLARALRSFGVSPGFTAGMYGESVGHSRFTLNIEPPGIAHAMAVCHPRSPAMCVCDVTAESVNNVLDAVDSVKRARVRACGGIFALSMMDCAWAIAA